MGSLFDLNLRDSRDGDKRKVCETEEGFARMVDMGLKKLCRIIGKRGQIPEPVLEQLVAFRAAIDHFHDDDHTECGKHGDPGFVVEMHTKARIKVLVHAGPLNETPKVPVFARGDMFETSDETVVWLIQDLSHKSSWLAVNEFWRLTEISYASLEGYERLDPAKQDPFGDDPVLIDPPPSWLRLPKSRPFDEIPTTEMGSLPDYLPR